jgi:hypothetical protein
MATASRTANARVEGAIVDLLKGAAGDCNQNGLVDAYDILHGDAVDTDGNGVPDSCGNQGGGGTGTGTEPCPPDGLRQVKLDVLPDGEAPFKLDAITELGRAAQMLGGQLGAMLPEGATNDAEGLELRFRCPRGFRAAGPAPSVQWHWTQGGRGDLRHGPAPTRASTPRSPRPR